MSNWPMRQKHSFFYSVKGNLGACFGQQAGSLVLGDLPDMAQPPGSV
jgi:hypothetical protein